MTYFWVVSVEDDFGGFCWSMHWTHLYKLRRTHRRAVVAMVVSVAVAAVMVAVLAAVAVVTAATPTHTSPRVAAVTAATASATTTATTHACVCASEFVEVCPEYGPTKILKNTLKNPKSYSTLTTQR